LWVDEVGVREHVEGCELVIDVWEGTDTEWFDASK